MLIHKLPWACVLVNNRCSEQAPQEVCATCVELARRTDVICCVCVSPCIYYIIVCIFTQTIRHF